jgi:hypothetical protein
MISFSMRHKEVDVVVCDWLSKQEPIATVMVLANSCQVGTNPRMYSEILLKNNDTSGQKKNSYIKH